MWNSSVRNADLFPVIISGITSARVGPRGGAQRWLLGWSSCGAGGSPTGPSLRSAPSVWLPRFQCTRLSPVSSGTSCRPSRDHRLLSLGAGGRNPAPGSVCWLLLGCPVPSVTWFPCPALVLRCAAGLLLRLPPGSLLSLPLRLSRLSSPTLSFTRIFSFSNYVWFFLKSGHFCLISSGLLILQLYPLFLWTVDTCLYSFSDICMPAPGNLFLLTNQWWFEGDLVIFFIRSSFLVYLNLWETWRHQTLKSFNNCTKFLFSESPLFLFNALFLFFLWLIISAWNILYLPLSPDATAFSLKVRLRCLGFIQFSRILLRSNNCSLSDLLWPFVISYGSYAMCVVCVMCVCVFACARMCSLCIVV